MPAADGVMLLLTSEAGERLRSKVKLVMKVKTEAGGTYTFIYSADAFSQSSAQEREA